MNWKSITSWKIYSIYLCRGPNISLVQSMRWRMTHSVTSITISNHESGMAGNELIWCYCANVVYVKKGVDETFPRLLYDLFRVLGEFSVSCIPHQGFLKMHYRHILVSRYHKFTYDIGNWNLTQPFSVNWYVTCVMSDLMDLIHLFEEEKNNDTEGCLKSKLPRDVGNSKSEIRKDCLNNRTHASHILDGTRCPEAWHVAISHRFKKISANLSELG